PVDQHLSIVGLTEVDAPVEYAQSHVDPAIAHSEDPAVTGQQRVATVATGQFQPRLEVVVVVSKSRPVVASYRHSDRPVFPLGQSERQGEPAGYAVGGNSQRRAKLDR